MEKIKTIRIKFGLFWNDVKDKIAVCRHYLLCMLPTKNKPFPRYMMGTTAIHNLGDISRDVPDLCYINKESGDNYIGVWETGYGFVEVKFPKKTTRNLTRCEVRYYNKKSIRHSNGITHKLKVN